MKGNDYFGTESRQGTSPQLLISVTNLDIEVEEGKEYKGSFLIRSENQLPIHGKVISTNDKIRLESPDLSSAKKEIVFCFLGKFSMAGAEYEGDFVILTNAGEYNIPYRIRVIPKSANTSMGRISTMEEFALLYRDCPREAMELFFLSDFAAVFLGEDPERQSMYHSFMKGRSRPLILEEFMTAAGYKEVVSLEAEEESLFLEKDADKGIIRVRASQPGYVEGRVYSERRLVAPSVTEFYAADFKEGWLEIAIRKNHRSPSGSDRIHIATVRQDLTVLVEWWEEEPDYGADQNKGQGIKRLKAELMHNYLYFRTGSIGFEDFVQEAHSTIDELLTLTNDRVWKLYLLHLFLMEEDRVEAESIEKEIRGDLEKGREDGEEVLSPLAAQYFLYLQAMLRRTPEAIGEAVASIRRFYETSDRKAEALWMLIYLDREYVYNKRLQYDTIHQLFQAGNKSCLLFFEACELLNENPDFMEEAGPFETGVFRWGLRYGFVSMSLAYQFVRLALKMKYYSRPVFSTAIKLYHVEPDERFLQVICSLLIKGNKTGRDYHTYFYKAVEANLKIVGLNEFFIRSMDFSSYEEIPQRVLIYFTYSNSLDYVEKAYLYTNILKNRDKYEEVFGAYYSKMLPFVEEQLIRGRMNEHLAFLYTHFREDLLEKPENTKAVCDVLFQHRILCDHPRMIGVYIVSPETGEENYYPLSSGTCQVSLTSSRSVIYFADSGEQRYVSGISYEKHPFLMLSQFPREWIISNISNKKILLTLSKKVDEALTHKELPILERIAFNQDYRPWMQKRALEKLLRYHEHHQNKKDLARWLEKTDYSDISPAFRKKLMDYFLEAGLTDKAFRGAELFGSRIMGSAKRLRLAVYGISRSEGKRDDTALTLAWSAFVGKKYNKESLGYLMEYFDGELEDLLLIWERSRKQDLPTMDIEKKIIRQSVFTGNDTTGVYPVFESLYQTSPEDPLIKEYLEYLSGREMASRLTLPDSIQEIIGKEILSGRVKDKRTKVQFLYYFAKKADWHERIHEAAEAVITEFLKEEFYLPVYQDYSSWVSFPIDYSERTFLTYHGGEGRSINLYYQIEGEKEEPRRKHLLEVLPGMYVASLHFYQSDHVNYRLEADGEAVENEEDILFETFEYEGDDSRFFELNYLGIKEKTPGELKTYLQKAFFTDEFMELL